MSRWAARRPYMIAPRAFPVLTDCSVYASVKAMPSPAAADAVVIGGGTVGGWCAYFLRRSGAGRVVLIERSTLGRGASSRAAGVVRAQGGTPTAVRLARWSMDFYRRQQD